MDEPKQEAHVGEERAALLGLVAEPGDLEVAEEPAPDFRRTPAGGIAFGTTREPEYGTAGDAAPPADANRPGATFGAATQDDPFPPAIYPYPLEGEGGDLTLVAVFEDIEWASHCARDLERRGFEVGIVAHRGDGPEPGISPGNVSTGPPESHPKDRPMGGGVAVGATLGATAGLLWATYLFPPFAATFATGSLVTTLAGAGIGSFVGGLWQYGATEKRDDASIYAGPVRRGGAILLARVAGERADEARLLIGIWNPLEIRVQ